MDDLDYLKNQDCIDEDDYTKCKSFSENSNDEFINIETDDYDTVLAWNLLELKSLNYEAVLKDFGCSLATDVFEDSFFKWISTEFTCFWRPTKKEKDFDSDVYALCKVLKVEVEHVFYELLFGLSDLLDERCFDTNETFLEFEEKILDYDY